jgi:L-lactate dehydrogenase complex protein LldG
MSSSREQILAAVRGNQPAAVALPGLPDFDADAPTTLALFADALARLGGRLVMPQATLADTLRAIHPQAQVIVSATPEVAGTRALPDAAEPAALDDVDVGVVRAAFGIAETGSVYLSEAELGVNALGFLPQHLVVLLDPAAILPGVQQAWRHPAFRSARYAVLMSGPTATADIEGVLIRGAQGVRSLTVVPCAAP